MSAPLNNPVIEIFGVDEPPPLPLVMSSSEVRARKLAKRFLSDLAKEEDPETRRAAVSQIQMAMEHEG